MRLTRREVLKLSLLGGLAGLNACLSLSATPLDLSGRRRAVPSPFQSPMPIPPVLKPAFSSPSEDYYEIAMQPADLQILPQGEPTTRFWVYNGIVPGPTIVANKDKAVHIKHINRLGGVVHLDGTQVDTSVHLHGAHVPAIDDGHPNDLIQPVGRAKPLLPIKYQLYPKGEKVYHYPNHQDHATLWYHDHADEHTGENVYMGLAGFYLLHDPHELSLKLPSGAYDISIVIQDKTFNADGSFFYPKTPLDMNTLQSGFLGDTILVNGAIQPYLEVERRKYRFRILNGSNGRQYNLTLSDGAFIQIGTEGGLLRAPVPRTAIRIAQAERFDLVIDFTNYPIGGTVELLNTFSQPGSGTHQLMQFKIGPDAPDTSVVPAKLRDIPELSGATQNRSWQLALIGNNWTVNGQTYNLNRADAQPKLNSIERWQFSNFSPNPHPMHPHDGMYQIAGHPELGWKDTFNVLNGQTLEIIMPFEDYTGDYVFHCHNLEHEDHMMMSQFRVVE